MAHPYLSQLIEIANAVDLGDADLICMHFFSGAALYADGKIIALLSPKGLAFKLSNARCDDIVSKGIAVPMCYSNNSPAKQGYVVFEDVGELSTDNIRCYLQESISAYEQNAA
jgi:hypothetical protein